MRAANALLMAALLGLPSMAVAGKTQPDPLEYPGLEPRTTKVNDSILLVTTIPEAQGFKIEFHQKLSAMKNPECTAWIDRAHWMQDLFLQSESAVHFDNCAFEDGIAFVQGNAARIRELGAKADRDASARKEALFLLGRTLHTIQDFYAHSNYVELMDAAAAADSDIEHAIPVVPFWTADGQQKIERLRQQADKQRLISGTWPIGWPKRCTSEVSHGELNKDNKTSDAGSADLKHKQWKSSIGFLAAYDVARRATVQFIQDVVPAKLVASCGGALAAGVVTADGRPPQPASPKP